MPLTPTEKIWMNGKFVDWKDAKTHVLTHALHYGSGVFEGIRAYETPKGPAVFRLKEHIARLYYSAKVYMMDIPYSEEEFCKAVKETVKINKIKSCYIRPIVYRGYGEMGLNPLKSKVDCAIAVWPWGAYLGEEGIKNGIRVAVSSWTRLHPNTLPGKAKATGNYINSQLAKIEAIKGGYDEALMLDYTGKIAEGSGENLFIVKNGTLITPPEGDCVLIGITRDSVMKIAKDLKIPIVERSISRDELYQAEEVFMTGTAAEVTPIREVDDRAVGNGKPGPVTKKIQEKYFAAIRGKEKKYDKWLAYVNK